jgi:aryl-alcohol dehydrogenase-like predicted oxidoreductase
MHYRTIAGTDLRISALALGGWLTLGDRLDDDSSQRLLAAAVDGGINFLDLADIYGHGGAERVVGAFLRTIRREQVVISSKVFWPMSDRPEDRGLSRRHILASIDGTLARLGTDHLDLYFCHREDPNVPLAETVAAMGELVRSGKVRAWGTSCWRLRTLAAACQLARELGVDPPRLEQPQYSLLERSVEARLLPGCQQLGIGVVAFSPLAGGVLTGKYLDAEQRGDLGDSRAAVSRWNDEYLRQHRIAPVAAFVAACRARAVAPAVAALAWVMQKPGVTAAISGASRPTQLQQNLAAATFTFGSEGAGWVERCFPPPSRSLWQAVRRWWRQ